MLSVATEALRFSSSQNISVKLFPPLSVMYITDSLPQTGAQCTTRTGWKANSGEPLARRTGPRGRALKEGCFHAYSAGVGRRTDFKKNAPVVWGCGQSANQRS